MLARIRKAQQNDEGFTLIELLVVIIIIGILAAIAIPTFLKQREKGYLAAIKSDVKNATTAEESYATDNNGAYLSAASAKTGALNTDHGFNGTTEVTVKATATTGPDAFSLCGASSKLSSGNRFVHYSSATGLTTVDAVAC